MATKAEGNDCYERAADQEPVFTLRAQDLTADTVVEFWAFLNSAIQHALNTGKDPDVVLVEIKAQLRALYEPWPRYFNQKIVDAEACANEMREWSSRKWPD